MMTERIAAIALAVCFLTDPKTEPPKDADLATLTDSFYDETLDEKIFAAMQAQSGGKYLEGECYTEAHYVFDTEEKKGVVKVVVCDSKVGLDWMVYFEMLDGAGGFVSGCGERDAVGVDAMVK